MPEFRYEAISKTGEKVKGTYEAETKNHVLIMLKGKELFPVKVEEVIKGKEIGVGIFNRVKTKDIAIFCRQFHVMLNAGVSIIKCLDILRYQTDNKRLKIVLTEVYEEVQNKIVEKGLTDVKEEVRKGIDLATPIDKIGFFPPMNANSEIVERAAAMWLAENGAPDDDVTWDGTGGQAWEDYLDEWPEGITSATITSGGSITVN